MATRVQAHRWQDRVKQLRADKLLLLPVILLTLIGLVMVGSASGAIAVDHGLSPYYYLIRHSVFLFGGLVLGLLCMRLPIRWLQKSSRAMLLLMVLIILLPLVPGLGHEVNGSARWINLGISRFQVVEVVKLMLIIYLAGYLEQRANLLPNRFFETIKPLGLVALLSIILLAQPDLGSAMVLAAITLGLLFLAGAAWRYLFMLLMAATPMFGYAALEPYRLRRIVSFLDPWADVNGSGFQLAQALIAIGRGELFGVGLGASVQKLFYLPEAHTDFIFAVMAEELGLVGVACVIILYLALTTRILLIGLQAHREAKPFAGFVCWGIGLWLAMQALINMGVNLGVLPTKGLTLPLISSGGSSLLMTCAAIGIVVRIKLELDRASLSRPQTRTPVRRDCSVGSVA